MTTDNPNTMIDVRPLQTDEVCLQGFINYIRTMIARATENYEIEFNLLNEQVKVLQGVCPHRLWVRVPVHSGLPRAACECCGKPGGFWCDARPGGGPCVMSSDVGECIFCNERFF
jgi:hypothetical protein